MPYSQEDSVKHKTLLPQDKKKYPLSCHYLEFRNHTKEERKKRIENFFKMTRKN
jgi:hypothetical protein